MLQSPLPRMGILTEVIALGTVVQRIRTKFLLENKSALSSPCRLSGEIRPETNEYNNFMYRLTKDARKCLHRTSPWRKKAMKKLHVMYCSHNCIANVTRQQGSFRISPKPNLGQTEHLINKSECVSVCLFVCLCVCSGLTL
jgi:hypothetical protein